MTILRSTTALVAIAAPLACSAGRAEPPDEPAWRRYVKGPLTADDFRAEPPRNRQGSGGVQLQALTVTELRNAFRYRSTRNEETSVATLTSIEFFAVVLRDKSWNTAPRDRLLLDHEQGHFDLTEIHAQRAQRRFDRILAADGMRGEGPNAAAARDDLVDQIKRAAAEHNKALHEAHRDYDRQTRHGSDRRAQAEHRRVQRETLEVLRRERQRK